MFGLVGIVVVAGGFLVFNIYKKQTHQEAPTKPPSPRSSLQEQRETIKIVRLNSSYKSVDSPPVKGWFSTGQKADIVLSWFGFNVSGGPLMFNHPMGLASDGKRLLLADTRNNRILIWKDLPVGNSPPDLVLGQKTFQTSDPGTSADKLRWPVAVATDGEKVVVADTFNYRVLIWNKFPTQNGEPADLVLGQKSFEAVDLRPQPNKLSWPWAVWTDGEKLIVTSTLEGKVYIWNQFPKYNNQPPDIRLENKDFGTPRSITTDGKSYLIIGDHNAKQTHSGTFFWHYFPKTNDAPYDAFVEEVLWHPEVYKNDFYASAHGGNTVYRIKNFKNLRGDFQLSQLEKQGRAVVVKKELDGGDGSEMIYLKKGNKDLTYLSLYNGGRIQGYFAPPDQIDKKPDFVIGSESDSNPFTDKYYFMDNNVPISYKGSLVVFSGFNKRIEVWRKIPDESGVLPDLVYECDIQFELLDGDVYKDKIYIAGHGAQESGLLVWKWQDIIEGRQPELLLSKKIGGIALSEVKGIAVDDRYGYITAGNSLYLWKQPINWEKPFFKKIDFEEQISRVKTNGRTLALTTEMGRNILLVNIDSLKNSKPTYIKLSFGGYPFIDEKHLFAADIPNNRVLIWNQIPTKSDEQPDIVIGKKSLERDLPPEYTQDGLFWPKSVWFDGSFLWVGEVKFSNRLLRYSIKP